MSINEMLTTEIKEVIARLEDKKAVKELSVEGMRDLYKELFNQEITIGKVAAKNRIIKEARMVLNYALLSNKDSRTLQERNN